MAHKTLHWRWWTDSLNGHQLDDLYFSETDKTDYVGFFSSSPPSVAYMGLWNGSALAQIVAWRRIGAKPLSKPMLDYCQLDPREIQDSSCMKRHMLISSAKWWPFCPGGDELISKYEVIFWFQHHPKFCNSEIWVYHRVITVRFNKCNTAVEAHVNTQSDMIIKTPVGDFKRSHHKTSFLIDLKRGHGHNEIPSEYINTWAYLQWSL